MKHAGLIAATFALSAVLAHAQAPAQPAGPTARLAEVADRDVFDSSGAKLADIFDVVIDTEEARASYLVVSVGMRVVPIAIPSADVVAAGEKVVLKMDRARLEGIASLDMVALGPRYKRGRDMPGGELRDKQNVKIATVRDMVVNLVDGSLAAVVVEFEPKAWDKSGWVALPRSSVEPRGRDFVATFNLDDMRPASQAAAEQRRFDLARAAALTVDRDERVSELVGRKIVDSKFAPVGEIADVAIETSSGRVPYVLVKGASGNSALALPIKDLTRKDNTLVLPAGVQPGAAPAGGTRRASELTGKALVDPRGKEVGKLRDIIVNLAKATVHYAVAEFEPTWVAPGNVVTIRLPRDDMKVELNALMGAMIFQYAGAWPDINNPQFTANIDAYLARH